MAVSVSGGYLGPGFCNKRFEYLVRIWVCIWVVRI